MCISVILYIHRAIDKDKNKFIANKFHSSINRERLLHVSVIIYLVQSDGSHCTEYLGTRGMYLKSKYVFTFT